MHDFIPPKVRDRIVQRVTILFSPAMPQDEADRALKILMELSPNNIRFSQFDENSLKIAFSMPLLESKFNRIIEVMKDWGLRILNWEKA